MPEFLSQGKLVPSSVSSVRAQLLFQQEAALKIPVGNPPCPITLHWALQTTRRATSACISVLTLSHSCPTWPGYEHTTICKKRPFPIPLDYPWPYDTILGKSQATTAENPKSTLRKPHQHQVSHGLVECSLPNWGALCQSHKLELRRTPTYLIYGVKLVLRALMFTSHT